MKAKQIYHYSLGDEVGDKWITEAEAQAISLDNDSLLMLMRRQIFLYYARTNDTIHTLRLFHLQEPLLITRNNKKELNLYHTSLTVLYARLNQMDKATYWHLQTRRMNEHKLSLWYGNMSQYLMDAGRNDEALLYADSCLNYRPLNTSIRLANAYPVKGQILSTRGQISEAMRLYAAALNEMEEFRQKRTKPSAPPIVGFSPSERLIIYQYAELLYQSGRIPEACIQLERLLAVSNGHEQLLKEGADLYNMRYKRGDYLFPQFLLAQCYQALGQTAKAIRYTQTGDSLQSAYTAYLWQQRNWLAEYRINYLIGLIDSQPGITIDKLYSSAGFTVRSTFYRQFHQVTGLTPKQYMKEREDPC